MPLAFVALSHGLAFLLSPVILPVEPEPQNYRIGELSRRSGLSVKTVRFYCDQGLIHPCSRTKGGFRLFDAGALAELSLIRAFRAMDVPIAELVSILDIRRSGVCNCSVLRSSIHSKIDSIDQRVMALTAMKHELEQLLQGWRDCGGAKRK
ncbi:MerR family DNA-binding transcriptional regulator [Synechococcus sp. FGCU-3]|nr:MerR family DNA-binding transcriptional regulator [Synechococcus sp. FGCU3]